MAGKRRISAALLPLALSSLLTGCINLGGGKPLPSLMTLTPAARAPAGQTLSTASAQAIIVLTPEVDRTLATTRVPVQVTPTSMAYLTGAAWAEWPARLFQSLLVETIRARGKRLVFEEDQPQGSVRLAGRLETMGYDAQAHTVTVRYDAERIGPNGVTSTRRFEAVEKDIDPAAADVAPALNDAANDVARQVADWVDQ